MDSITQAALGAVVGELVLGRKIGWKGMAWGALFGTLPDLDILAYPLLDEAAKLRWHRGISHSILAMVVATLALAKPLAWVHRGRGVSARRAACFVFLAWSTHVLIDVFTTYGTQVFEPFSDTRVAFNNLFIIDLFFTLPLLGCVVFRIIRGLILLWCWFTKRESSLGKGEFSLRPARVAVSLSVLYVGFSFAMKFWAVGQVRDRMTREVPGGEIVAVAPTPFNTLLWRGLVETEEAFYLTYWSPFDEQVAPFDRLPKNETLVAPFQNEELFKALQWFSRGHWVARRGPEDAIIFIDVRFGEVRDVNSGSQLPMFQWRLKYDEDGIFQARSYRPRDVEFKAVFGLLWDRLRGQQEAWNSVPPF